ncbi:MAG: PAS domain S-box protein, partial [Chloroflexota bacterium]|nr:PAS domain S-box protein [Chloroflexota bacterium]
KEQVSGRRKGKSESYEIVCIGEGGRRIPIIAAASPIFGADGHFGGSFGVLTDITQRKWVEEELKKHRDHLDELVKERTAELTAAIEQLHREITERKRVEGALRESEEKYRSLVERANDGIAIAQDALLKYVNQRLTAMTGYTVEEMINTPFADYIFPGELATVAERYERRMAGEDVTPVYETALRHKDGRRIEVEFNVGMTTYQEKPASLAFVRDITARKQAEEEIRKYTAALEEARNNLELRVEERTKELQEAQEKLLAAERLAVLGQFSGNISHELRNPLGVIDSSVYYLKTKLKDTDPKVTQHLDRIGENVRHSTTIIESLRNLTRVQEPRKVRLDLVAVVDDAFLTSRVPRSVELVREMPEERLFVDGDPEQLRMTFKNIVRNAIDAMGGQGTLTLRTQIAKEGQFAQVAFKDTGPGIAPENLGKIFQPLFSTKVTGLGFGLSICQRIVEQHSGTIEAQSEPGQGATFIVRLPLLP